MKGGNHGAYIAAYYINRINLVISTYLYLYSNYVHKLLEALYQDIFAGVLNIFYLFTQLFFSNQSA